MIIKSVEQHKHELDYSGTISIPHTSGIYKVMAYPDFIFKPKFSTTAISEYKGKSLLYDIRSLTDKYNSIRPLTGEDRNTLYIGKATDLYQRIRCFVKYAYGEVNKHRGGRSLWQLDNCHKLLIAYYPCSNPREAERAELERFIYTNGALPFANRVR